MAMKMRLEMKHKSHIYHLNRSRLRHGHEYNIYNMCLTIMMAISKTEAKLKKGAAYKKPCNSD